MTVYLLHIEPPLAHARHYIGFTSDPTADRRIAEHMAGGAKGSPLIRAALAAGRRVSVAHVFEGDAAGRDFEANLKAQRNTRGWCPHCGINARRLPDPSRISARFRAAKIDRSASRD